MSYCEKLWRCICCKTASGYEEIDSTEQSSTSALLQGTRNDNANQNAWQDIQDQLPQLIVTQPIIAVSEHLLPSADRSIDDFITRSTTELFLATEKQANVHRVCFKVTGVNTSKRLSTSLEALIDSNGLGSALKLDKFHGTDSTHLTRSNPALPLERDPVDQERFIRRQFRKSLSTGVVEDVNLTESTNSLYSGEGEGTRSNVTVRGEAQFFLHYNYKRGTLEVGILMLKDLAPVDTKLNKTDPYVKVNLLPDKSKAAKRKTTVKKNTLNPVFEETLSFALPLASLSTRTLWLSVWHKDKYGQKVFLGEVTLPLADCDLIGRSPMWYNLCEKKKPSNEASEQATRGDLLIALKFELQETGSVKGKGTLHVLLKEAKNLVATKPNVLADVFCKGYLLPERGLLSKQKTDVARNTLNPRWGQIFMYRGLKKKELSKRALEISLWDRDRLAFNEFMGAVRLSLGTGIYKGTNVNWMDSVGKEVTLWQAMIQQPNVWVKGSLPLRPQLNN